MPNPRENPPAIRPTGGTGSAASYRLERWIALLPASLAAWYVALVIGFLILRTAESICPEDQRVSDCCVAPWWVPVETAIFCFSTGLSALLVLATAFFVAPAARAPVAWLAFAAGSVVAVVFSIGQSAATWGMCASAIATGLLTALLLSRSRFSLSTGGDDRPVADGSADGPG